MKKLIIFALAAVIMVGCADEKTFKRADGTEFTAEPYGWMNQSKKVDGVVYDINAGNVVWSILLCETLIAPVILTGTEFFEPVDYVEPEK